MIELCDLFIGKNGKIVYKIYLMVFLVDVNGNI